VNDNSLFFFLWKKKNQKKPVPDFKIGAGSEVLHPLPDGVFQFGFCTSVVKDSEAMMTFTI